LDIGVGAGKLFGVRGFLPKLPQTCPKNTPKMTFKQIKRLHFDFRRIFFTSKQSISSTIFAPISPKLAQISPNLPEKKKTSALPFSALF